MMQLTRITIWFLLTVLAPLAVLPAGTSICVCPPTVCACDDGDGPAPRTEDDGESEAVTPTGCCCCGAPTGVTGEEGPLAEAPPAPRRPCHRLAVGELPNVIVEAVASIERPDLLTVRPDHEAFRAVLETREVRCATTRWRHRSPNVWPPTRPLPLLV